MAGLSARGGRRLSYSADTIHGKTRRREPAGLGGVDLCDEDRGHVLTGGEGDCEGDWEYCEGDCE